MTTVEKDRRFYIKLDAIGASERLDALWDDGVGGRIMKILLWHENDHISGIQTIYGSDSGTLSSKRHGGSNGNFVMINPKKPLTWLSGYYGTYCLDYDLVCLNEEEESWNNVKSILSLKFGNKEETYGPFGRETGTPFSFQGNDEIVGFHGYERSTCLSMIGPYIDIGVTGFLAEPASTSKKTLKIEGNNKAS